YGRRRCREGSVPPVWRAASSLDMVYPRSVASVRRHRFNEVDAAGVAAAGRSFTRSGGGRVTSRGGAAGVGRGAGRR
ncbi:hypothetical protein, partial [Micromonospora sp. ATA51]|uniref:hypothetical protein n=1 Tax=Micromonospora sp. ATA51 TaxID=2806098 RepID=UPI001EE3F873